jgi:hypothetical protein
MSDSRSALPFERPDQMADALREQGATQAESADLLPALLRLGEWQAPRPDPTQTQLLLARLEKELGAVSPVRQAIRENRQRRIAFLLTTARAQVSLLGLGFWLVSALITALGAVVVLTRLLPDEALLLRASGPLLAYMGIVVAFRGRGVRVLEMELVCLPSPLQLAVARLVIVLGYDVALGLGLSLVFWAGGTGQALLLTLSWLMPLLLVAGLALILSLRLTVQAAASVAYVSWLAVVAITTASNLHTLLLAPGLSLLGCIGLALLSVALLRLHPDMNHLLPQT